MTKAGASTAPALTQLHSVWPPRSTCGSKPLSSPLLRLTTKTLFCVSLYTEAFGSTIERRASPYGMTCGGGTDVHSSVGQH